MKARFMMIIVALLLTVPLSVNAEQASSIRKLDNISDEALQMIKVYRYDDANRLLGHFEEEFLTVNGQAHPFTMDELRIITVAHDEAVAATVSSSMDHDERMNKVTKFRLAMDALLSTHQPLWTEMEEPIMTVFNSMRIAADNGDNKNFDSSLDSFLSLYNMIYPSLKIDIAPERIQQLNTRVNFIDHSRQEVMTQGNGKEELEALEQDLEAIFNEMTEDETDPSLWWVIFSTGSLIILTLSYVGWKKYKANKERRLNRQKERKN